MFDIVFPNKNENEFVAIAQKLGYKGLVFVYPNKIEELKSHVKFNVHFGVLADPHKAYQFREKGILTFVQCSDKDRMVLERGSADVLFGAESTQPKDYAHQRGSGLNQVMCTLAQKNEIVIGFSLASILSAQGSQRAQLIGRIMQNIRLCRKYKVRVIIGSFARDPWQMRSPHDTQSFFVELGMHPAEVKNAMQAQFKTLER